MTPASSSREQFEKVLQAIREGRMVVLVDDVDRENEGDLVVAAEKVTPEILAFMFDQGRGLVCLALPEERLRALGLPRQAAENGSPLGTNFAVSFDHKSVVSIGVTAEGRAKTILKAVKAESAPEDFVRPGFVFPLGAVPGGVLRRRGQTEGSVDLAQLAGLIPGGVICEIMAEDGTMLRGEGLRQYCEKYSLPLVSVAEIAQFRIENETNVRRVSEMSLETMEDFTRSPDLSRLFQEVKGISRLAVYVDDVDGREHFALICGNAEQHNASAPPLVRVHSECLTGDVFGSRRCDCGFQLDESLRRIFESRSGVLIYLHQEGRGIGLSNKLRAYELQDQGRDTVEANLELGLAADSRNYRVAARILHDLGVHSVRLMTNNPAKVKSLTGFGIEIVERIPIQAPVDDFNRSYLETKKAKMGHLI